jgi:nicotinate-nucleotide adenylyltransferase
VAPTPGDDPGRGAGSGREGGRVGILGGSFDPPHLGHLVAVQEVAERLDLDEVMLIPAAIPPHKVGGNGPSEPTPGSLRLRMVRAAVTDHPTLTDSDLELRRDGVSWTIDTLRELRELRPADELFLVIGADQWATFAAWREPIEIGRLATVVVMTRAGDGADHPARGDVAAGVRPECLEVRVPRIDISSTEIRRRVREGRSIRYLVPDDVRRIIEAAKLYIREP